MYYPVFNRSSTWQQLMRVWNYKILTDLEIRNSIHHQYALILIDTSMQQFKYKKFKEVYLCYVLISTLINSVTRRVKENGVYSISYFPFSTAES